MPSDPKTDVLHLLVDRIPNYVNEVTIQQRLKQHQTDTLTTALRDLVAVGTVEAKVDPQPSVGKPANYYRLKNFLGLPVRQSIRVGDVEIPRLLADSQAS